MSLPTPITLSVRRRLVGAKDQHGNPVITYGPPSPWLVHGYAPGASSQPQQPGRDLSLIEWTVYAPANTWAPGELDRVVLGGDDYDVAARPDDWSHGPWPHPTAGVVVELTRPEG